MGKPFNQLQAPTNCVLLVVLWRLRDKLSLRDVSGGFLTCGFTGNADHRQRRINAGKRRAAMHAQSFAERS